MKKNRLIFVATIIFISVITIFFMNSRSVFPSNISTDVPKLRSMEHFYKNNYSRLTTIEDGSKFDVIVIGSDPEGITAAIAAARAGEKTLLIDKNPIVGGLFTLGKLNMLDLNRSPSNKILTKGLFLEFYKKINKRTSFDVRQVQTVFEEMLRHEKNLTVKLGAEDIKPALTANKLHVGALTFTDSTNSTEKTKKIYAKKYIDATPDADFAHLAGATFKIGQEDYRNQQKMMAVTLVFELSGVDWNKVREYLNTDEKKDTGADQYSAWGYGKEMARYKPTQNNVRIRALNIGKQDNGNVLINAFQILDVNGLNKVELNEARRKADIELPRITEFLRQNLVGFEHVKLVGTAERFYVRETRHLQAEYQLTIDDVLENRDFRDRIAFGSYPIDVQATIQSEGDLIVGDPQQYAIPFRSIVPKGFDNLLIASRSAGYDSLAHGSARTVPVGMVIGQAAGVAAAYANGKNISFQTIVQDQSFTHIQTIQHILNKNGANLEAIPHYNNLVVKHWAYAGVKFLRSFALIEAWYNNDYKLNQPLSKKRFNELVQFVATYSQVQFKITIPSIVNNQKNSPMTQKDVREFLKANSLTQADLSSITQKHLQQQNGVVSRDILYMVIMEFFRLKANNPQD